mgnify:CR=1 FL=1
MSKRAEVRRSLNEENTYLKEYIKFMEAALDALATVTDNVGKCKTCKHDMKKFLDSHGIKMEEDRMDGKDTLLGL